MRILFISHTNCALDLAVILKLQGNDVDVIITDAEAVDVGKNMGINIILGLDKLNEIKSKYDLFINDDVYFGNISNKLRKEGRPVIGGSVDTDTWENNRQIGMKVMELADIPVPETQEFSDYQEALDFVSESEDLYVLKYSGMEGTAKSKTVVPLVKEELLWYLEDFSASSSSDSKFILQKMIRGTEVAFSWWWNGEDIVGDVFMNFEHKRMFNGDMGVLCGESGTVVYGVDDRIIRENFSGIFTFLKASGYRGVIDINTIYGEDGKFYGLEWTPRFGYPIMQCMNRQYLHSGVNLADLLFNVATGKSDIPELKDSARCGVVVGYFVTGKPDSIPIFIDNLNFEKDILDGIGLDDVMYDDKNNCFVAVRSASGSWYRRVLVGVGCSSKLSEGIVKVYKTMERFKSTSGWYRTDIGKDIKRFERMGVRI